MNCAFDKEKLTGFFDGELEAAEKAEVERHIASCSECLRELGELKSAALLVKELPRLRAPKSIAEGISREIQSSGKVHSLAKFRRGLMMASGIAAACFVVLNIVYFTSPRPEKSAVALHQEPPSAVAPIARIPEKQAEADRQQEGVSRRAVERGAAAEQNKAGEPELRKNLADAKKLDPAPEDAARREAPKPTAAPGVVVAAKEKSEALGKAAAEEKPAPPAAPKPEPAPVTSADKPAAKAESAKPEPESELRLKKTSAPEPVVEAAPTHLTVASTQLAKARPQVEEALKKMGLSLPAPTPAPKTPQRSRDAETSFDLVLTDAQISKLRQELEKQGTNRLVLGSPEDPVLVQFKGGGLYGAKRDAASGGAAAPAPAPAGPKKPAEFKEKEAKDGKEAEDPAAAKAGADAVADKGGEAKRKVVLHLMEVKSFGDNPPAADALKK